MSLFNIIDFTRLNNEYMKNTLKTPATPENPTTPKNPTTSATSATPATSSIST